MNSTAKSPIEHERIATHCVCCGSDSLSKSPAVLMPFIAHRAFDWRPVVIDDSWGLKSLAQGHAYSVCNSLFCNQCQLLFLDIRFDDKEMSRIYSGYRNEEYVALREHYEPGYRSRNELLNKGVNFLDEVEAFIRPHLRRSPSVLDWGGDTGKNTPFKSENRQVDIYDISGKDTVLGARRVTKEMISSQIYDLVVCSQVLEHVPYPADVLNQVRDCMKKDTLLYIELPHEDLMKQATTNPVTAKRHWHEHINFFSQLALERLLNRVGLHVIDIRSIEVETPGKRAGIFQALARLC